MGKFYVTNLPDEAPAYVVSSDIGMAFEAAVRSIRQRTDKLNEALENTGMESNKFHEIASGIFAQDSDHFDSMSAEELAQIVKLLDNGKPANGFRLEWPNATVLFDTAFTSEKEWESLRHIGIGGSDTAALMGASHYTTPRMLYHDKRGTKMAVEDKASQAVFDRGHIIEDKVINELCRITHSERIPESRMFASKEFPYSTANIDGIIRFPDDRIYIVEAKTTVRSNKLAWTDGKIPAMYINQTRQYLGVLNDERISGTYISCFFTSDVIVGDSYFGSFYDEEESLTHLVAPDPVKQHDLLELENDFVNEYLIPGIEPELGMDLKLEIDFQNRMTGTVIPEDDEDEYVTIEASKEDVEEYMAIKKEEKALNDRIKGLSDRLDSSKLQILAELDGRTEGRIYTSDGKYIEVKNILTKSTTKVDTEKLKFAYPEAFEACAYEAEGYRKFSITEKVERPKKKKATV